MVPTYYDLSTTVPRLVHSCTTCDRRVGAFLQAAFSQERRGWGVAFNSTGLAERCSVERCRTNRATQRGIEVVG